MGWLSGWGYRKSHVINSASGAGTNYQIKVVVYYGSGTDSGENVYLNSHCRTDFGDVRFADDDGTTLLDYWMEKKVDSSYAVFWVEVADDLSSNSATIYIYYGKSDATTTSNGDATFLLFDHFLSLDTNKWTVVEGTFTVADSLLKDDAVSTGETIRSNSQFSNLRIRLYSKFLAPWSYSRFCVFARWDGNADPNAYGYVFQLDKAPNLKLIRKFTDGTRTNLASASGSEPYLWRTWDFLLYGTNKKILMDGSQVLSETTDNTYSSGYIGFDSSDQPYYDWQVDWVFVAKYVSPEPSHGSWGSEETLGGQTYEISVDAIVKSLLTSAYETTYNIQKDAIVASQNPHTQETMFKIEKEILVETLSEVVVEKVVGQIFEIFKDAITQASVFPQVFGLYPVNFESLVKASAMPSFQQTLGISKDAVTAAVSTLLTQSAFNISPEAAIKVLAEVSIIKPTEVKVTRLFLVMGDLAIQIQGG